MGEEERVEKSVWGRTGGVEGVGRRGGEKGLGKRGCGRRGWGK